MENQEESPSCQSTKGPVEEGGQGQPPPRLLEQVRNVMRLHHYSIHTEGEMRMASQTSAIQEPTPVSQIGRLTGWFKMLNWQYYIEANDFRHHLVTVSYDNAGTISGYCDNETSSAAAGMTNVFGASSLNELVLGSGLDRFGRAANFTIGTYKMASGPQRSCPRISRIGTNLFFGSPPIREIRVICGPEGDLNQT